MIFHWLPDMDLNHDKQIQSLLCYRYTIGQTSGPKVRPARGESRTLRRRMNGWLDEWIDGLTAKFSLCSTIQPSDHPFIYWAYSASQASEMHWIPNATR